MILAPNISNFRKHLPETTIHTHKQCTLVSVAFRFNRRLFAFPGKPYITDQLTELDAENCSRRS